MKALRAKCLDCSGGSAREAKLCVIRECPLWVYRFGKRPENVESKWLDPDYVKAAGLDQCCDQLVRECGESFRAPQFYQTSQETIAAGIKPGNAREVAEGHRRKHFCATDEESDTLTAQSVPLPLTVRFAQEMR